MEQQNQFVEGLRVFRPHANAPAWIKCEVVVEPEFIAYYNANRDYEGKIRATMCVSKDGSKLYFRKNDWRPQQQPQQPQAPVAAPPQQPPYTPPQNPADAYVQQNPPPQQWGEQEEIPF